LKESSMRRSAGKRLARTNGSAKSPIVRKRTFRAGSRSSSKSSSQSKILYVTSEMADFVKVGGLGDVSSALPRALRDHHDVRVMIPGYREILARHADISVVARLPAVSGLPACDLGRIETAYGLVAYIVLCPDLYDREGSPYGDTSRLDWADNDIRFARLSLAAAELANGLPDLDWRPDLLHLNDWPSALAAAYLAWRGVSTPTILTVHNLAYQGLFGAERLPVLGIPADSFGVNGVEFFGKLSFLKAGIFYASHVTTVSATYARKITTPELGCGLHGLLRTRADQGQLTGILNGIDETWTRHTDSHPVGRPDGDDGNGRRLSTAYVRKAFGLAVSRGPLFAVVSRLVHQKGIDLTIQGAEALLREGGQLVVTGRGEAHLESALQKLAVRHPGNVGVRIGFDESEARQIFAGSDFLLMPSRFEPCGLSQMYAQSVGTLPVASRTGGLADTVEDGVTGFLFEETSLPGLLGAMYRAVDTYASPRKLKAMRCAAMRRHFGWARPVGQYNALYGDLLAAVRR
jgi:starch synthase